MIFNWKKVPLHKCLAKLWEFRRISHALCPLPILEEFINLSKDFGEKLDSTKYWMDCLRESQALVVGFYNSFSFPGGPSNDESSSPSYITVDKVKEVASEVISCVSSSLSFKHDIYVMP
jgi:separase